MNKSISVSGLTAILMAVVALCATSCSPEAKWEVNDVAIQMDIQTVSAGFAICEFSTNKDAYYLIDCVPVKAGADHPYDQAKQFMTMAIDSAYIEYLQWRYWLLEEGEFNIAPFSSHALEYGTVQKVFTNLAPGSDYWIYAFVVNPETLKPVGKLNLQTIHTSDTSLYNVHFDYRVRGRYDYIYPINEEDQSINFYFPYLAATRDSAMMAEMGYPAPEYYFDELFTTISLMDNKDAVRYGVNVTKNDGFNSDEYFEEGHTYYTAIVSYDGFMGNNVIYKFTWTGEDCDLTFTDEDNIAGLGQDE